jgi:hypothetical protein
MFFVEPRHGAALQIYNDQYRQFNIYLFINE